MSVIVHAKYILISLYNVFSANANLVEMTDVRGGPGSFRWLGNTCDYQTNYTRTRHWGADEDIWQTIPNSYIYSHAWGY